MVGRKRLAAVAATVALLLVSCGTAVDDGGSDEAAVPETASADSAPVSAATSATAEETSPATTETAAPPITAAAAAGESDPQESAETEEQAESGEAAADGDAADATGDAAAEEPADDGTEQSAQSGQDDDEADEADEPEVDDPPDTVTASPNVARVVALLEVLQVAAEVDGGYDRHLFKHWVDADRNGCDARREVLIAEAVVAPSIAPRCSLSNGEWLSPYDGKTTGGNGRGFDVDHMVPLQEAWQSGARDWTADRREQYANDLGYADSLVAVSAASNRSKGARDPAEWMPPAAGVHCWYSAAWVQVKTRWSLTVDRAEADKLRSVLSGCDDDELDDVAAAQAVPAEAAADDERAAEEETETDEPKEAEPEAEPAGDCHPAYEPCLPNLEGDAINCGDLTSAQKPVRVKEIGVDPYRLDRDGDGRGCTS